MNINNNLTQEQLFEIEKTKRYIQKCTKEELENFLIQSIIHRMMCQNFFVKKFKESVYEQINNTRNNSSA